MNSAVTGGHEAQVLHVGHGEHGLLVVVIRPLATTPADIHVHVLANIDMLKWSKFLI